MARVFRLELILIVPKAQWLVVTDERSVYSSSSTSLSFLPWDSATAG